MFISTRSAAPAITAAQAIVDGIAPDGGLFVPQHLPALGADILAAGPLSYGQLAFGLLRPFFPDFSEQGLREAIASAYARFDRPEVVPLVSHEGLHFLELFHGPTLAFKDLALTLMGGLTALARRQLALDDRLVILVATSGDTGKAALAGFSDMPGVRVVVYYPARGVSPIQRLQMVTHRAANTEVIGIEGSFDDAQRGVKELFGDAELATALRKRGIRLSSANSINIARLLPQIVYYVKAWRDLREAGRLGPGESMDVAVPTGNFGNILAARYAKMMGLPIRRLICASNSNRVLTDFLATRRYDRNRPFHLTTSPSMDILVSSNLERLLFEASGRSPERTAGLMGELGAKGSYQVSPEEAGRFSDFVGASADDHQAAAAIRRVFDESGYLIDPHTAVAVAALASLGPVSRDASRDGVPIVVAATASPFKFPSAVAAALGEAEEGRRAEPAAGRGTVLAEAGGRTALGDIALAEELAARAGLELPAAITELRQAPVLHDSVVAVEDMRASLLHSLAAL
ncbi:MAG TPA: threonine synthase [Rectinemataceae bacterium]|nr:threonine synthase [Rectinemataceae bacterium]